MQVLKQQLWILSPLPAPAKRGNPLEAADAVYQKIQKAVQRKEDNRYPGLREHLRKQAWEAIRHLVEPEDHHDHAIGDRKFSDTDWKQLKEKVARLTISWDEQKQDYVVATKLAEPVAAVKIDPICISPARRIFLCHWLKRYCR